MIMKGDVIDASQRTTYLYDDFGADQLAFEDERCTGWPSLETYKLKDGTSELQAKEVLLVTR
ncbi:hypothetical protein IWQ62_003007 [Dispira parvispora]|uniref:Uncharacterized protein n=1 Tax=Dispira parvispora TaxID=1520584 RepID=A0A9W8ASN0_9FUNG|nr:hypothetical protein IWQ62_003007 [Dispira parvispora]